MNITIPSSTISIYYHDDNGDTYSVHCKTPTINIENNIYYITYNTNDITYHFSTIKIGKKLFLHNDSKPALTEDGEFDFFQYGQPVLIEDLPCDEDVKVCLMLKYTLYECDEDEPNSFFTYT